MRLLLARLRAWRATSRRLCLRIWQLSWLRFHSDVVPFRARAPTGTPRALEAWIACFESPPPEAWERLMAGDHGKMDVQVLVWPDSSSSPAATLMERLAGLRGLRAGVCVAGMQVPPLELEVLRDALAASGHTLVPPNELRVGQATLVLGAQAWARNYGPRILFDALLRAPNTALAYGDEVHADTNGSLLGFWCKPCWSTLLARQHLLPGGMFACRLPAGGLPPDPHGLMAMLAGNGDLHAVRVSHLVSQWRGAIPSAPSWESTALGLGEHPLVSILIPTRNRWDLLEGCLASVSRSTWPAERREVIVVDNGSDDSETIARLRDEELAGRIRLLNDPGSFNYARLNNLAAASARGEFLVLLNNDTVVLQADWLERLVAMAERPGVGAVGPKLLYPDGTVQHAGLVLGVHGYASHVNVGLAGNAPGYWRSAVTTREVSAVTGACLVVRRELYRQTGGLDERFPVTFNDVAFCLNLQRRGLRNIYLAEPLLMHDESRSRGLAMDDRKRSEWMHAARIVWQEHRAMMADDPWYSPCLSLERPFEPAFVPRRRPAWEHWMPPVPRVMILIGTGRLAHSQAALVASQTSALMAAGFQVILGAQRRPSDISTSGCRRLALRDARAATAAAYREQVAAVVVHAIPFHEVARHAGGLFPVVACDYGEACELSVIPALVRNQLREQRSLAMAACSLILAADASAHEAGNSLVAVLAQLGVSTSPGVAEGA